MLKIAAPQFIASFQTIHNFLDILQGHRMISNIRKTIRKTRSDESEFDKVFEDMEQMAVLSGGTTTIPKLCSRQTQGNNVPATSPKVYFKSSIYIPYLDSLIQQLAIRFSGLA